MVRRPTHEFKGINVEILATSAPNLLISACLPIRLSFSRVMQSRWPCLQNVSLRISRPASALVNALLRLDPRRWTCHVKPAIELSGLVAILPSLAVHSSDTEESPRRVRCGFATYFQVGQGLDHWITEYWRGTESRWVRIDSEILGGECWSTQRIAAWRFLSGGEGVELFSQR